MTAAAEIERRVRELTAFPDRNVGGPGNLAATAMFAREAERAGFEVARRDFDCIVWEHGGAELKVAGEAFDVLCGHYSLACDVTARLACACEPADLETDAIRGAIVLLMRGLAAEQLMPKNFKFHVSERHQRVIRALEEHGPAALVAATGRNPGLAGSVCPFPVIEDGDFDIPNAYMKDVDGERLAEHAGENVHLRLDSRRVPATAEHVVARLAGDRPGRIVLAAHIDSAIDSPGAMDNASGVSTLLAVADRLSGYGAGPAIELVPFNGEDNYANRGEILWLEENEGRLDDVLVGINVDDCGVRGTDNHVSFYNCPIHLESSIRSLVEARPRTRVGPQWFQGDHMVLAMNGCPALAVACSDTAEFMRRYAHSSRDTIELLDASLIDEAAGLIRDAIASLVGT